MRVFLLLFSVYLICIPAAAQGDLELWYNAPAREWTAAMPVGNGRLGAMVFGDHKHERIQLNEESLWGGSRINNNNPLAKQYLPDIQKAVFQGEYQKVWDMADKYLLGTPAEIRSYQPLGNLFINYSWPQQPVAYRRSLVLNTGISRTSYSVGGNSIVQEVFVSAPHDVIVVNIRAELPIDFDMLLSRDRDTDAYSADSGTVWFTGQIRDADSPKKGPGGLHMRFSAAMKILSGNGTATAFSSDTSAGYRITATREVTVILTGATDYNFQKLDMDPAIDPLQKCRELLSKASRESSARLRVMHEKEHRSYFDRVKFRLGKGGEKTLPTNERLEKVKSGLIDPELIALYYQYGRYLLMASSRTPGKLPANLQGIWNEQYTAKWNSDFHTNINLQMNYWPAETGNLSETSEVLAQFVKQLMVPGSVTAREMYDAQGWTVHHLTDVFGRTGVADGAWGFSPMAGPWMTFPVYRHYEFTGDESYLSNVAYPIIKGSVLFVLDFLIESPEGYLVTNPSHSPENPFVIPGTEGKVKAYLSYAATIDVQIIRALFKNFMNSAQVLNRDSALVVRVNETLQKLPPMKIGSNGTLQEWFHDYEEFEPGHRHISHLLGLYPLDLISPENPALFEGARKTIERRMANSQRHVGWSSAWIINFYARLLDGEKAGEQVRRLLQYSTLGSLLNTIPPFQIDGNFGGAAGIAEMLLQSHNQVLHLLPALPRSWKEGSIEGLRARGGYTVDMEWRSGKLRRLVIHANRPGLCRIRYLDNEIQLRLEKGKNILSSERRLFD